VIGNASVMTLSSVSDYLNEKLRVEVMVRPFLVEVARINGIRSSMFIPSFWIRRQLRKYASQISAEDKILLHQPLSSISDDVLSILCLDRGFSPTTNRHQLEAQLLYWVGISNQMGDVDAVVHALILVNCADFLNMKVDEKFSLAQFGHASRYSLVY